ncbi:hypothetical protein BFP78_00085 [Gaetbulibacter sp. 5U11]|nr:hypothetical protein BFP78_00085 [Gaetbulibacter sp. 5U11]
MNETEFLYIITAPLIVGLIIAILNIDGVNNVIDNFHKWINKQHANSKSGIAKFFFSLFKVPNQFAQKIEHEGWRSGMTFVTSTIAISLTVSVISGALFVGFWLLIAAVGLGILYIALMIIGGGK